MQTEQAAREKGSTTARKKQRRDAPAGASFASAPTPPSSSNVRTLPHVSETSTRAAANPPQPSPQSPPASREPSSADHPQPPASSFSRDQVPASRAKGTCPTEQLVLMEAAGPSLQPRGKTTQEHQKPAVTELGEMLPALTSCPLGIPTQPPTIAPASEDSTRSQSQPPASSLRIGDGESDALCNSVAEQREKGGDADTLPSRSTDSAQAQKAAKRAVKQQRKALKAARAAAAAAIPSGPASVAEAALTSTPELKLEGTLPVGSGELLSAAAQQLPPTPPCAPAVCGTPTCDTNAQPPSSTSFHAQSGASHAMGSCPIEQLPGTGGDGLSDETWGIAPLPGDASSCIPTQAPNHLPASEDLHCTHTQPPASCLQIGDGSGVALCSSGPGEQQATEVERTRMRDDGADTSRQQTLKKKKKKRVKDTSGPADAAAALHPQPTPVAGSVPATKSEFEGTPPAHSEPILSAAVQPMPPSHDTSQATEQPCGDARPRPPASTCYNHTQANSMGSIPTEQQALPDAAGPSLPCDVGRKALQRASGNKERQAASKMGKALSPPVASAVPHIPSAPSNLSQASGKAPDAYTQQQPHVGDKAADEDSQCTIETGQQEMMGDQGDILGGYKSVQEFAEAADKVLEELEEYKAEEKRQANARMPRQPQAARKRSGKKSTRGGSTAGKSKLLHSQPSASAGESASDGAASQAASQKTAKGGRSNKKSANNTAPTGASADPHVPASSGMEAGVGAERLSQQSGPSAGKKAVCEKARRITRVGTSRTTSSGSKGVSTATTESLSTVPMVKAPRTNAKHVHTASGPFKVNPAVATSFFTAVVACCNSRRYFEQYHTHAQKPPREHLSPAWLQHSQQVEGIRIGRASPLSTRRTRLQQSEAQQDVCARTWSHPTVGPSDRPLWSLLNLDEKDPDLMMPKENVAVWAEAVRAHGGDAMGVRTDLDADD